MIENKIEAQTKLDTIWAGLKPSVGDYARLDKWFRICYN